MPLFEELIPAIAEQEVPGLVYVSSSPTGGTLPFHDDTGVAHYFGVGAYRRPITDARLADVRFASECLAFANPPDILSAEQAKARTGVAHDNGTDWDFADITDHYVHELFAVDADSLRTTDPDRYLDLARATTGTLIEATFAEWRRAGSRCAGGLIWFLRDLRAGSGWGMVDAAGNPKASWWFARRAMAPVALFALDEGLNGVHLHVRNDGAAALEGTLRVDLFSRGELLSESAEHVIDVAGRSAQRLSADALFDGFRDLTWAYRFGPATYDVIAATLVNREGEALSHAFHLPLGLAREREDDVGLSATAAPMGDGRWSLTLRAKRFAESVALRLDGHRPDDNWFHLAPSTDRIVTLEPLHDDGRPPVGDARAINAIARCAIELAQPTEFESRRTHFKARTERELESISNLDRRALWQPCCFVVVRCHHAHLPVAVPTSGSGKVRGSDRFRQGQIQHFRQ
jgi:beta-mannosidase